MNSIETAAPLIVGTSDSDGKDLSSLLGSDPAALEILRAMIGGIIPQQAGGLPSSASGESEANGAKTLFTKIQTLLTKALADESLPPSLAPIMTALQGRLSSTGTAAHQGGTALSSDLTPALLPPGQSFAQQAEDAGTSAGPLFSPEALMLMKQMLSSLDGTTFAPATDTSLQEIRLALTAALNRPSAEDVTAPLKTEPTEAPPPPDVSSLGHSILHSLGAHSSTAAAATQSAGHAPSAERVEQVSALITEMADRVLVTDPLHGQTQEVRITLADNLMPGTDLRVWREDGGQLRVEFDTVSPYWARVLNEASPLLTQRLNERLGQPDQLAVVTVQQQGGQPEDGRSRNRQSPWELAQQSLNS